MEQYLMLFTTVTLGIYILWEVVMLLSWIFIKSSNIEGLNNEFFVSVIVPFRNEAENLPILIESLKHQDYNNYEVLLVNDHSTDNFYLSELPIKFQLLNAPDLNQGKKQAIACGIAQAKGEIIITTDADCQFDEKWISTLVGEFISDDVKMVFGGVRFLESKSLFGKLQQIEFAPVIGVGAALNQVGNPIMCNGANLAFRKSAFEEVNGYEGNLDVPSGDDEFLLYKIRSQYPKGVKFSKSLSSVVTTPPCSTLSQFYHQRKRWASKWSANKGLLKSTLAILVFLSSVATIAGFVLFILNPSNLLLSLLLGKILIDGFFIFSVLKSLGRSFNPIVFLLTQLIYPFYVFIIGIASNFGSYKWKGRNF